MLIHIVLPVSSCPKDPALLKLLADLKEQSEEFWAKLKASYQGKLLKLDSYPQSLPHAWWDKWKKICN